jgi:sulfur relay (sulfurtransferase) complex TusBCD TusD component (DsrE family)
VKAARIKKHEIRGIFFFGTGVLNVKQKIQIGKNNRNVPALLEELVKDKIPMFVCQTWADNYGIFAGDTIPGVQIVGLGELGTLTNESDKIVVFGSHT